MGVADTHLAACLNNQRWRSGGDRASISLPRERKPLSGGKLVLQNPPLKRLPVEPSGSAVELVAYVHSSVREYTKDRNMPMLMRLLALLNAGYLQI